jgi:hypothetical protein
MELSSEEKSVLVNLYKSNCSEDTIKSLTVGVVKSLKSKGWIQAVINYDEIVDIRIPPKTKEYINDYLL